MGTYFKPLQRKIGVITLVIACLFAAGWARSVLVHDMVFIPQNESSTLVVSSESGRMSVQTRMVRNFHWSWLTEIVRHPSESKQPLLLPPYGTEEGYVDIGRSIGMKKWWIAYWPIVLPLTLFSAYLLFSKPKHPKPTADTQVRS